MFFLKNIFLQILPTVRGSMNSTAAAEISACTQGEHGQIGTPWHIQRGSFQRFQQVLRGSMDSRMFIKEREYLGPPFALDVKGGE
jgi:hypothetical protein